MTAIKERLRGRRGAAARRRAAKMHAQVIRQDRYGEPKRGLPARGRPRTRHRPATRCWSTSWRPASTTTASGPRSASRSTSSAATSRPATPATRRASTSAAATRSGIVYAVGDEVTNVKVGDEVVLHCGMWDDDDPVIVGRRRPRAQQLVPHLGLRQQLGQLRPVHARPGPPVPAQAAAPQLGGGRRLHARRRDRLPHARLLAAAHRARRRRRPGLGRLRRPRLAWASRSRRPSAASRSPSSPTTSAASTA